MGQVLLETPSFEKCPLRVYTSRLTTFASIVMVTSASTSVLTRMYAYARTPGKSVYRSGTGSLEKLLQFWMRLLENKAVV